VLVIGSGSAGLCAALTTAQGGLDTIVLEKGDRLGGTSSISGAGTWVPANHHAKAAGINDSPEDALTYITSVAPPGWREKEEKRWRRFASEAPRMLEFVERYTPLEFSLTNQGDPMAESPGAKSHGRMLSPKPLSLRLLGPYRRLLHPSELPLIFSYQEVLRHDPYHHPIQATARLLPRLLWRWLTVTRGMGAALIAGLLKGCLDHGCRIETQARAISLIRTPDGHIGGARIEHQGREKRFYARIGVVIASGGFEWDAERVRQHFPGPTDFIASPRTNEGDGHRMAEAVGAELAHMDQANLSPGVPSRRSPYPRGLSIYFHRLPNAIIVDRTGRRFLNEYAFNLGEKIDQRDKATGAPLHLPAWFITDVRFLERSPIVRFFGRKQPRWMVRAPSLSELARRIGVPPETLLTTVDRYHSFCANGADLDFKRHKTPPYENLEPITRAPFIAIPFNRTFVSTKGGPKTDANGQVVGVDGRRIPGLYCAGVAMDNPFGTWAVGAGTTIGPNMTWGYICGKSLLEAAQTVKGR
jgi:Succinate dehydrogenase/fumarate reductase, flavoprotein subunit